MTSKEHYLRTELYDLVRRDPAIFEFLQAGSLDGIWYWDVERQEQEWMSPRFKELFGYRDEEIPNTSAWWMENIFPEDRAVALENFSRHLADASHPYDQIVRYRHRDGSTIWVRCRGLAIRNAQGAAIRLLGCHTDVTALKRAEEDLRRQAAELREARDAAERASIAKSTFLANVSHEIRTPLNGVIGMADLLGDTDLDPGQQEQVAVIRESAEALLEIINDILDFSKIEAGRLVVEPHPFRLRERLSALVTSCAPRVHGKDVTLAADIAADTPDALVGDARLLRQVLANLLSNAIKFTDQGAIGLRVRPRKRGGRPDHPGVRGQRYRHRDPAREAAGHLRGVRAGGRIDDAPLRGHGPRPGDRDAPRRRAGRRDRLDQRARGRQHVPRHRTVPPGPGRGPRAGRGTGIGSRAAAPARAARRGQRRQPARRHRPAAEGGPFRARRLRRHRSRRGLRERALRCRADGPPDARHGRLRSHSGHPERGAGAPGGPHPDRRADCPRFARE